MLYTYPHVEDYIEIIAGYRGFDGSNQYNIFQTPASLLNLARYDVKVLESFAEQSRNNIGFTDRQAKLAIDLVLKYERQLFKNRVTIETIKTNPVFRTPLREIDRSTRAWVEDDIIKLKFPYNAALIEVIRNQCKESCGRIHFNRATKLWEADLTEYNVNWVYTFSKSNQFEIDSSLSDLMDLLLQAEQSDYKIELQVNNNNLYITNAETTLVEYIETQLGGFDDANLLTLVDYSPLLGYTTNKVINDTISKTYGTRFLKLCMNKEFRINLNIPAGEYIQDIVAYARATYRFPIYVYEPNQSEMLTSMLAKCFEENEIVDLNKTNEIPKNTKLVYANKIPKHKIDTIPLMLSSAGMLYGGDRQVWIQTAEKVVYFSADVYNKSTSKGREICRLD
jgi:hypothetical protein